MRIVIAGGGTGGHLYPGIALAHELLQLRPDSSVLFVGTQRGLEARVVPAEGFELATIHVRGMVGRGIWRAAASIARVPVALWQAGAVLRRFRPDLVIGVGGYSAGPTIVAARMMRRAIVLLEQNVLPGVTNRLVAPLADLVIAAFDESRRAFRGRVEVLGNPVRRTVVAAGRTPLPAGASLLVFGGSQGAVAINRAITGALARLSEIPGLSIVHQTGRTDFAVTQAAYAAARVAAKVEPYLDDMGTAYANASLVVSRAGATSVAELTACGRPAVLIPYPHAAHNHQECNANALEAAGAAHVMSERQLTPDGLARVIAELFGDRARLARMAEASRRLGRPDAAERIARRCVALAEG